MRFLPLPPQSTEPAAVFPEIQALAQRAEEFYETELKTRLEATHHGAFVSIEPDSRTYFLGRSLEEASAAARQANPGRIPYTRRVGYPVVFEIGHSA